MLYKEDAYLHTLTF